jgi:hypothetical protein
LNILERDNQLNSFQEKIARNMIATAEFVSLESSMRKPAAIVELEVQDNLLVQARQFDYFPENFQQSALTPMFLYVQSPSIDTIDNIIIFLCNIL